MSQKQYKPHYEHLKNKWREQNSHLQKNVWEKHKAAFDWIQQQSKHAIVGTVGSLFLLVQPVSAAVPTPLVAPTPAPNEQKVTDPAENKQKLIEDLSVLLPDKVQELSDSEETVVAQTLTRHFDMIIKPSINGIRLNRSYGLIGAEQHLMRYPGDTMATHFATAEESSLYYSSGMAPGRGAWGYFAPSYTDMTQQDVEREKWYIAVQTFLAPGFNTNTREYYQFFKYRKMLVVNPENGKAVIAVIGDAGPSPWTGKHLGGSPEVMKYLIRNGFRSASIHGNKSQGQRQRALEQFKQQQLQVLLATDVASRGLDIENVTHVINYDIPATYDDYIHRIGRTGRADKKGTALTFVE